jgi:hypothetical protein
MPLSGPAIATVALLAGRVEPFSRDDEPCDGERADELLSVKVLIAVVQGGLS